MKNLIALVLSLLISQAVLAEGVGLPLEDADVDITDLESLKRGARIYMDYCAGCHSVKHMRYSRMATDLKLSEEQLKAAGLMPPDSRSLDSIEGSMNAEDSKNWLSVDPPDLSLVSRARGEDWLFSYLKGFYVDSESPTGSNNAVLKNVGMPNVLWQLQGIQRPVFKQIPGEGEALDKLVIDHPGTQSPEQFAAAVNDLVAFLAYVGEPARFDRVRYGKFVLLGLLALSLVLYRLKAEYWKKTATAP
ncbi:MAG: cytochrome c1 [Methylococcaceae bacterium]|nr:cytochrome c1 [Methylococcaceae bacterium]